MSGQTKGVLLAVGGALAFTPDALLVRLTSTDAFTLASGRMFAACATIVIAMILARGWKTTRDQFLALGRYGLLASLLQAMSSLLFCIAISNTSAANALLLFATTPLISAFLAFVLFRERISGRTWVAILFVLLAIGIVSAGSFGSANLFGDAMALANAVSTASFYIVVQRQRGISFMPALALGCLIGAFLALPMARPDTLEPSQFAWLLVGGGIVLPMAIAAFTLALGHIPAAEVSLISLLEVILGPLLVLAVLGEAIPQATFVGGTILLVTLGSHILTSLREGAVLPPGPAGVPDRSAL